MISSFVRHLISCGGIVELSLVCRVPCGNIGEHVWRQCSCRLDVHCTVAAETRAHSASVLASSCELVPPIFLHIFAPVLFPLLALVMHVLIFSCSFVQIYARKIFETRVWKVSVYTCTLCWLKQHWSGAVGVYVSFVFIRHGTGVCLEVAVMLHSCSEL